MSTFPEQFSAARQSQVEAQLVFFQNLGAQAVDGAEKIITLNLNTTRASIEKSSAAVRQLFSVKDPRDLFSLTTHTQEQFDSLLAYGRAVFSIASGAQAALLSRAAAPQELPRLTPPAAVFPVAAEVKPIAEAAASVAAAVAPEPVAADVAEIQAQLAEAQPELLAAKPKRKK